MRWLHADHAVRKCDYQSSCRSVFICCLAFNAIILLDIVGAILVLCDCCDFVHTNA